MYLPGFQRQVVKHIPKCKWFPLTKFQWIPRRNSCNINFVGTLILLRIPQRANIGSCSGFRKCNWIPQIYADSAYNFWIPLTFAKYAYNLRIPLTICGFHLQLRTPRQLKFTKHIYYNLFVDSTNWFRIPHIFLRIPQNCVFLEQFCATHCFNYLSVESKQQRRFLKNSNFADSETNLIFASCRFRLQFTKCTVSPRNETNLNLLNCI